MTQSRKSSTVASILLSCFAIAGTLSVASAWPGGGDGEILKNCTECVKCESNAAKCKNADDGDCMPNDCICSANGPGSNYICTQK